MRLSRLSDRQLKRLLARGEVRFGSLSPDVIVKALEEARRSAVQAAGKCWEFRTLPNGNWLRKELMKIFAKLDGASKDLYFLNEKVKKLDEFDY